MKHLYNLLGVRPFRDLNECSGLPSFFLHKLLEVTNVELKHAVSSVSTRNIGVHSCSCKTGKHTTEKPVIAKPSATINKAIPVPMPVPAPMTNASPKEACPRCRQGFFCSDHGSQPKQAIPKASNTVTSVPSESNTDVQQDHPAPVKKKVDISKPQICKNKGCGKTFTEKENHDTACSYHPGPAIFHDRIRGWKCCDVHVKEFDEFMSIAPCTKGWHNAGPVS